MIEVPAVLIALARLERLKDLLIEGRQVLTPGGPEEAGTISHRSRTPKRVAGA